MVDIIDEDRSIICTICLDEQVDDRSTTDVCNHPFCFSCLKEWFKVKSCCPLCKREFSLIIHDVKRDMLAYSVYCDAFLNNDFIRSVNNLKINYRRVHSTMKKSSCLCDDYGILLDKAICLFNRVDEIRSIQPTVGNVAVCDPKVITDSIRMGLEATRDLLSPCQVRLNMLSSTLKGADFALLAFSQNDRSTDDIDASGLRREVASVANSTDRFVRQLGLAYAEMKLIYELSSKNVELIEELMPDLL